jgi:hypothetical protein
MIIEIMNKKYIQLYEKSIQSFEQFYTTLTKILKCDKKGEMSRKPAPTQGQGNKGWTAEFPRVGRVKLGNFHRLCLSDHRTLTDRPLSLLPYKCYLSLFCRLTDYKCYVSNRRNQK